jgi:hypothetical protein
MQIQDFVKLLYQSCFGPKHLHRNPSKDFVLNYMNQELENSTSIHRTMEDIGNGFVRIYLDMIHDEILEKEKLVDLFMASMEIDIDWVSAEALFYNGLNTLQVMIAESLLPFNIDEYHLFITTYQSQGIHPVHHSDIFKKLYSPHYRVVSKSLL